MEILTDGTHTIVTEVIRKPLYFTATTPSHPIFFDKIQLFYYVQLSINKITDTHLHLPILYNFLPVSCSLVVAVTTAPPPYLDTINIRAISQSHINIIDHFQSRSWVGYYFWY